MPCSTRDVPGSFRNPPEECLPTTSELPRAEAGHRISNGIDFSPVGPPRRRRRRRTRTCRVFRPRFAFQPAGDSERISRPAAYLAVPGSPDAGPVEIERERSRGRSCGRSVVPSARPATIVGAADVGGSNTFGRGVRPGSAHDRRTGRESPMKSEASRRHELTRSVPPSAAGARGSNRTLADTFTLSDAPGRSRAVPARPRPRCRRRRLHPRR